MGLFLQHEVHVTRISVGVLVSFVAESDFMSVRSPFLNVNFQNFTFLLRSEALALSTAAVTRALHLLDHRTHTNHLDFDTTTVTAVTGADAKLLVEHLTVDGHLFGGPIVHLLQWNLQWLHYVLGSLATTAASTTTTAAEHGGENVISSTTTTAATFDSFQPTTVVRRPLLLIAQDVVCHGNLLKLLRVATFVRVVCLGQLQVRPPDFVV
mmetsp:Transcript_10737/g.23976  ORF Transcript_10737/g.23976 Transcript_10737/m.23976 type:complete len:210 (-) Transcript_10737:174-803(-)